MIFFLGKGEHFILLHQNMTLEKFLINAKVRENSYMGRVMKEIYKSLTVPKINLVAEYNNYYSAEYRSIKLFLYKKYPVLTNEEISKICKVIESGEHNIFRGYFKELSCYNVQTLFEIEDGFYDKISSFLKWDENEN